MNYPPQYPQADNTAPIPIVPPQPPPGYVYVPQQYALPAPAKPKTNVAAIVSMSTACFALIFPWLGAFTVLGLVAVITGLVGHRQALKEDRGLGKVALGGLLLGLMVLVAAFGRAAT